MAPPSDPRTPHVAPLYRAAGAPAWYHVLHGSAPLHEIALMYGPAVPQGQLTQTHFNHVTSLMKYVDPDDGAPFAFAIGNLSCHDVQHEPGHGGLALILCRRVEGVVDHAGRTRPPYAHGLIAIDRALDAATISDAAVKFHRRFMDDAHRGGFYHAYVRRMQRAPQSVEALLADRIAQFDDLPQPGPSKLGADFVARDGAPPPRVTVLIPDGAPFETVARVAASLASVLYRSNVRWTVISNGREQETPDGTSIWLVPQREAPRKREGLVIEQRDLPRTDAEMAKVLFAARARRPVISQRDGARPQLGRQVEQVSPPGADSNAAGPALARGTESARKAPAGSRKVHRIATYGGLVVAALTALVVLGRLDTSDSGALVPRPRTMCRWPPANEQPRAPGASPLMQGSGAPAPTLATSARASQPPAVVPPASKDTAHSTTSAPRGPGKPSRAAAQQIVNDKTARRPPVAKSEPAPATESLEPGAKSEPAPVTESPDQEQPATPAPGSCRLRGFKLCPKSASADKP